MMVNVVSSLGSPCLGGKLLMCSENIAGIHCIHKTYILELLIKKKGIGGHEDMCPVLLP